MVGGRKSAEVVSLLVVDAWFRRIFRSSRVGDDAAIGIDLDALAISRGAVSALNSPVDEIVVDK